jgi:Ribbon-helix-helix domain
MQRAEREQISVDVDRQLVDALRRLSYERDVPMTALVREGIHLVLAKWERERKNSNEG